MYDQTLIIYICGYGRMSRQCSRDTD